MYLEVNDHRKIIEINERKLTKTGDAGDIVKETQYPSCPHPWLWRWSAFTWRAKVNQPPISIGASCPDYTKNFAILIGLSKPALYTLSFLWNRSHIIFCWGPALVVLYQGAILRSELFLEVCSSTTFSIPWILPFLEFHESFTILILETAFFSVLPASAERKWPKPTLFYARKY